MKKISGLALTILFGVLLFGTSADKSHNMVSEQDFDFLQLVD